MKERFCTDLQPKLNLSIEEIGLYKEAGFQNIHISATDKPYTEKEIYKAVNDAEKAKKSVPISRLSESYG